MTFTVTRSSGLMVRPSDSTPSGSLNLSVIDAMPILRMDFHFLLVYKHGHDEAAKIIREAFSKALVPYYPLAGRLKESSDGALQVDCTGEGLWFIEASTDCSLESFNYYDNILLVPQDKLLPTPPLETSGLAPLLKVQLTRFTCEGFVMGFSLCHCLFDGLGAAQFLHAVGEFARGFLQPTVVPIWHRDAIPAPESLLRLLKNSKQPAPLVPIPCYQLEHASIDISLSQINKHKNEYKKLTGKYCSTFDVAVASLWCHRTQAIDLDKNTEVTLVFAVNTRQFVDPPLPKGYYGNCFYPARVTTSSGWLVEASNAEVVKLIKDATSKVAAKFRKLMSSNELDENDNPLSFPLSYTTLSISEWGHVGVFQIDYGWGNPVNVIPIQSFNIIPTAIVGLPPTPKKGIRLVTWCVERSHLPTLIQYYKQDNLSRL